MKRGRRKLKTRLESPDLKYSMHRSCHDSRLGIPVDAQISPGQGLRARAEQAVTEKRPRWRPSDRRSTRIAYP